MQRTISHGDNFSVTKLLKSAPKINGALFKRMKNKVLGRSYELSLVFIGNAGSKKLNMAYRGKDRPANILSFPLQKNQGEIFISPKAPAKEIASLFIHGLCHLKGLTHGSRMDNEEEKYRKIFKI